MIKALLFDKDGTLFDFYATWGPATLEAALLITEGDREQATYLLQQSGLDARTGRFAPGSLIASGSNGEIVDHWVKLLGREGERAVLYEKIEAHFRAHQIQGAVPVTELADLFAVLKLRGYRLGVATMDSEGSAQAAMKQWKADMHLDFICGFDTGHGVKPGGGMVRAFAECLGMETKEIAVIGDSPHDMEMAHDGGAGLAIGVLSGVSSRDTLLIHKAHHILENIQYLPDLLAQNL